jgi:hypothetical protein
MIKDKMTGWGKNKTEKEKNKKARHQEKDRSKWNTL